MFLKLGFLIIAQLLRRIGIAICIALSLSGCADGVIDFPVTNADSADFGPNVEVVVLDAQNIRGFSKSKRSFSSSSVPADRDWIYLVGAGDILSVIVFDHPELTLPAGPQRSAAESGFQVASDGTITYPYIGSVTAAGRNLGEIRAEISDRLSAFIPDPQVEVRVASFNSQSVVVSGEVKAPNRQPLTAVKLTLIEAINAAGGFSADADPRIVSLKRGGRSMTVDVQGFLEGGLSKNNPVLRNGDVVNVPFRRAEEAYLLGEISRPDVVDLSRETISLTQAITRRGGLDKPRADARGVLVFRAVAAKTKVFQLDTSSPEGLILGTKFVLEPNDIVYVLRAPIQRWNDTISRLLPTVQATSAVQTVTN